MIEADQPDELPGLIRLESALPCTGSLFFDAAGRDLRAKISGMARGDLIDEKLSDSVIGAFFDVYNGLGYGFLEHLYRMALERELVVRGHRVAREHCVRVVYKGEELGMQRLDLVVDDKLVVEIKSTQDLHRSANRQLYNYLRATNLEVGLLLHFGPAAKFFRVICKNK